jgi:hypothetical protein
MRGFLQGNASVLLGNKERCHRWKTGSIRLRLHATDVVSVSTPADVIERLEAVRNLCAGLTEVAVIINAGGVELWTIQAQELFVAVMPHFASKALGNGVLAQSA